LLAIPTTLILWLVHWWNGVDPILDLRNSFLIKPDPLAPSQPVLNRGTELALGPDSFGALTRGSLPWLFLAGSPVAPLVRVRWLPIDLGASLTESAAWVSITSASRGLLSHLGRKTGGEVANQRDK
jgi:hypothetical protein